MAGRPRRPPAKESTPHTARHPWKRFAMAVYPRRGFASWSSATASWSPKAISMATGATRCTTCAPPARASPRRWPASPSSRDCSAVDDPISQLIPRFDELREHGRSQARDHRPSPAQHELGARTATTGTRSSPGNEERMYDKPRLGAVHPRPAHGSTTPAPSPSYCTGGVVVLGYIISQRSGMALDAYASTYLFGPLGIRDSNWRRSPDGAPRAAAACGCGRGTPPNSGSSISTAEPGTARGSFRRPG